MEIDIPLTPALDPAFVPAALWNRAYQQRVAASHTHAAVAVALLRPDGTCSVHYTRMLPMRDALHAVSLRYLERLLKFLLWQRGASRVLISGADPLVAELKLIYSEEGERAFDVQFFGERVYGRGLQIEARDAGHMPEPNEQNLPLGRHLDGCRIGFDLGGSDRKCAAVIDGTPVFTEEIAWNPYFERDPEYHIRGIEDSLNRAAAHLPRVDAIGGSAAGVYVNNQVRVASLFRGVPEDLFEQRVRRLFLDCRARWGNIPFEVVNDGEVTALAGSMAMGCNGVLGVSMGTSEAAGFVTPEGHITPWLNELAFAPVDYGERAPTDEWSGDIGCGVQYFSQQAVARLAPAAGFRFDEAMPFPERLVAVQERMAAGDERAGRIYRTIGTYLGYTLAHYADFYDMQRVLLLGRVTSGHGGELIIAEASRVLEALFPEVAARLSIRTPDETDRRHGQAVAAASLPALETSV